MRLKDKVAIVTGATKGVGRGIAMRFAEQGAKVIIAGRTAEAGQEVEDTIRANGGIAKFVRTDLGVEDDCRNVVEAAEREFGPLTTLVNNAAATGLLMGEPGQPLRDANMHEVTNEAIEAMWRSDMWGLFWICRYALRAMLKHDNGGSIVNISSGSGWRGSTNKDAYTAQKGAMNAVTRSMAATYAISRIRVNAIILGLIDNGRNFALKEDDPGYLDAMHAMIPLPIFGEPNDIAYGAIYLASDEAKYVTGVELPIDGGSLNIKVAGRIDYAKT